MSRRNYAKSELFLMEFILVILFFTICASICITAFVQANNMSEASKTLNKAMILAQSTAERIKATEERRGEGLQAFYEEEYYMEVNTRLQEEMAVSDIFVYQDEKSKKEICRLVVKKYYPGEV